MGIEITPEMQEYAAGIFSKYKPAELDTLPKGFTRVILHLYPTHDTGENGYVESLFFTAKIYDVRSLQVWTVEGRDEVSLNVPWSRIRIFKDGSTMIAIDQPVSIRLHQSMAVDAI